MKKIISSVLALILLITIATPCFASDSYTYKQNLAKEGWELTNEFRYSDTWCWKEDNVSKVYSNKLNALNWNSTLEGYAKIRAREIAEKFSHTRPNGESSLSMFDSKFTSRGENILMGATTAKQAIGLWREDNDKYEGQGHRRNMLSTNYNCIGMACVVINGQYYWVQEFGYIAERGTIKSVSLSNTKFTYTGSTIHPTITVKDSLGNTLASNYYNVLYSNCRKPGTGTIKLTFINGYSGTASKTITIVPKGTSISKLTPGKGTIKVTLKKQATETTGYQIQIATNSKFTKGVKKYTISSNSTVSKTIKKLTKKKKYYVRVRTYKTSKSKNYYSSWSKVKTTTTK